MEAVRHPNAFLRHSEGFEESPHRVGLVVLNEADGRSHLLLLFVSLTLRNQLVEPVYEPQLAKQNALPHHLVDN